MTRTPRTYTHTVDTGDGYTATLSVTGFVDQDSETYLGELLGLAQAAFHDVYKSDFEESLVELYRHVFERVVEEEGKDSEFEVGYKVGLEAGRAEVLEPTVDTPLAA